MSENYLNKIVKRLKKVFIKTDLFREEIEDNLAKVLLNMSNYTTLDQVKSALISSALNIAISYTPVVGGVVVSLTSEQIETLSDQVILYGHKAEKLLAEQLQKKSQTYINNKVHTK